MVFYKMQIKAHNKTVHHILKNEVDLILLKFPEGQKTRIFSAIILGFVGLAFKEILSFLHIEGTKPCMKQLRPCQFKQMCKGTNLCI